MAISTKGTVLKVFTKGSTSGEPKATVAIKSFPDLGAAPTAIDVTTLKDEVQKFIPGVKTLSAMEFVANYEQTDFVALKGIEGQELTYVLEFGDVAKYAVDGTHAVTIAAGALNAAVDMKLTVLPNDDAGIKPVEA